MRPAVSSLYFRKLVLADRSSYNRQGCRKQIQESTVMESELTEPKATKTTLSQTCKNSAMPTDRHSHSKARIRISAPPATQIPIVTGN
jgi:hypothetical protein